MAVVVCWTSVFFNFLGELMWSDVLKGSIWVGRKDVYWSLSAVPWVFLWFEVVFEDTVLLAFQER